MPPKTTKAAKPDAKAPKVNQAWADLLRENEARAKAGEKPWTDDQLRERMQKTFPARKDKSTIVRVSMVRAVYNKGTNMFRKFGPGKPQSKCYNPDGSEGKNAGPKIPGKPKAGAARAKTGKVAKPGKKVVTLD